MIATKMGKESSKLRELMVERRWDALLELSDSIDCIRS